MTSIPMIDIVGYWLAIFLTFAILSFLYKDNPFYKFAEHLFIGVSIGYLVIRQVIDTILPKLITPLVGADGPIAYLLAVVPIALAVMMFFKLTKRWGWVGRYPVAFVVALFAGLQVNNVPNSDLITQLEPATSSVIVHKIDVNRAPADELTKLPGVSPAIARTIVDNRPFDDVRQLSDMPELSEVQRTVLREAYGPLQGIEARATVDPDGELYWFGIFSQLLLLVGLVCGLVYFYFSIPHTGVVGKVSRFGVWILMIGFGASFGFTVQGRLSLAIGRAMDILGRDKSEVVADQIHGPTVAAICMTIIIVGLVVWERRARKTRRAGE